MCFADMVAGDRGIAAQLYRRTHETWRQEAKKSDACLKEHVFVSWQKQINLFHYYDTRLFWKMLS